MTDTNTWRHKAERAELVERIIAQEAELNVYRRLLREYADHVGDDRADTSLLVAQQARIVGLERNLAVLIAEREAAA